MRFLLNPFLWARNKYKYELDDESNETDTIMPLLIGVVYYIIVICESLGKNLFNI